MDLSSLPVMDIRLFKKPARARSFGPQFHFKIDRETATEMHEAESVCSLQMMSQIYIAS
jgi:hypothetical protein